MSTNNKLDFSNLTNQQGQTVPSQNSTDIQSSQESIAPINNKQPLDFSNLLDVQVENPLGEYNPKRASLMDIVKFDDVYKYAGDQIGYVTKYPTYATWRDNADYYAQQQGKGEKFWNTMKTLGSLGVGAFVLGATELPVMLAAVGKGDWSYLHENQFAEGMAQKMTANI